MYLIGDGVDLNKSKGKEYLIKACKMKYKIACDIVNIIN